MILFLIVFFSQWHLKPILLLKHHRVVHLKELWEYGGEATNSAWECGVEWAGHRIIPKKMK